MVQDPYRVLGVSSTATEDEIKAAYRKLAKQYHPDVNNASPEAEAKMKEINEAYNILIKQKRSGYQTQNRYSSAGYAGSADSSEMQAAVNYIQMGYYREALNILERMSERTAKWYFLSAIAYSGIGSRIAALDNARRAVQMEPSNFEYQQLLNQLQQTGQAYQGFGDDFSGMFGRSFRMPQMRCSPFSYLCLGYWFLNCFCGRFFCC